MSSHEHKIIYIDIGTHKGQEFAAFNMREYEIYYKLIKHNIISFFSKRHKYLNLYKIKKLVMQLKLKIFHIRTMILLV